MSKSEDLPIRLAKVPVTRKSRIRGTLHVPLKVASAERGPEPADVPGAVPNAVEACRAWLKKHPPIRRRQPQQGKVIADYLAMLASVYGGLQRPQTVQPIQSSASLLVPALRGSAVSPNFAAFPVPLAGRRLVLQEGARRVWDAREKSNATDIQIGLDFGTAFTKVVLRDCTRRVHYAVPFFEVGVQNPFLLPASVFMESGGLYSLSPTELGKSRRAIHGLKLTLMHEAMNVAYMVHTVAYLALVIRHAQDWLLSEHSETFSDTEIAWGVNVGLPAEHSEDPYLSKRFKALALAAANLADAVDEVTEITAASYLELATRCLGGEAADKLGFTIWGDMVGVYPEIAAQVVAFVESERWDADSRPFITLVDIGAGTVDVSFFSVERQGRRMFRFFQNKVADNGVINLHRERLTWLTRLLADSGAMDSETKAFLDELGSAKEQLVSIPESVSVYVNGIDWSRSRTIDDDFVDLRYRKQVFGDVISPVHRRRVPRGDQWEALPVFVCGGGSRLRLYGEIVEQLNRIHGVSWLRAQRYHLTKPDNLRAHGLLDGDYDRLSVAYGLSFEEVGKIVRSHEIADFEDEPLPNVTAEAPGKELC